MKSVLLLIGVLVLTGFLIWSFSAMFFAMLTGFVWHLLVWIAALGLLLFLLHKLLTGWVDAKPKGKGEPSK